MGAYLLMALAVIFIAGLIIAAEVHLMILAVIVLAVVVPVGFIGTLFK